MRRWILIFAVIVLGPGSVMGQEADEPPRLSLAVVPIANVPVFGASGVLGPGYGGHLSVWYGLGQLPVVADLTVGYSQTDAVNTDARINTISGSLGAHLRLPVMQRLTVRAGGRFSYGYSTLTLGGDSGSAGAIGWFGVAGLEYALNDSWSATLEAAATAHDNTYVGLEAGLGVIFRPTFGSSGERREQTPLVQPEPVVEVTEADQEPAQSPQRETVENTREDLQLLAAGFDTVFPVFYRYYDANPVGMVTLRNNTNRGISNIGLLVNIPRFMDVAQKQAVPESLSAGEEVQVPLYVLFNDGLLGVTEGTRVAGEFTLTYDIGNSQESYTVDAPLNVADRNAMTWDDDRKAASFVTAKEPTVLAFAKNVSSVVRAAGHNTLNTPLRTGMAMLEAMALHGINYVVDPTSPYIEFSDQPFKIDFLQFPRQTFEFRAGDCDDIAICYASNLEAVGVKSAFITIPGHLYSAFSTGLSESEARGLFSRLDDFIVIDDEAWVPVETTLLQDGFLEAWRVGARQWREHAGRDQAALIPIQSAWLEFEPVGFDVQSGVAVSTPAPDAIQDAYNDQLQQFIARETRPQIARLETRIAATGDPRQINRLGVLYARYGMIDEAEQKFKEALEVGPQSDAYLNLGNLKFIRGDLLEAADYFDQARELAPEDPAVLLAVAKVHHELENYGMSDRAYASLQEVAPVIAADFEYLQFRGNDSARASDAAEKRNEIIWGEEEE